MTYVAPPYEWGVFVATLLYLVSVAHLMGYLARKHPSTWVAIGSPLMRVYPGLGNWFPLMGAIFLGFRLDFRQTARRGDEYGWCVASRFCFALIVVGYSTDLLPRD
jgi:hypothetical protein